MASRCRSARARCSASSASGSGKSVTGFAITRLLDAAGRVTAGDIRFRGQDITQISGGDFRHLHGAAMAMIFQNPRAALNPIRAVGDQIADAITAHKRMPRAEARAQALELLRAVQIRDPEKRMAAYPHELSGGMCQRVMIAMAIRLQPGAADRRRADHRPRRHDAEGGDGSSDRDRGRARHGDDPDHP